VLNDIDTAQRRDIVEKSAEIVLRVAGGYILWHLAILAKTIPTGKRGRRVCSLDTRTQTPRTSKMHYVRDVGRLLDLDSWDLRMLYSTHG